MIRFIILRVSGESTLMKLERNILVTIFGPIKDDIIGEKRRKTEGYKQCIMEKRDRNDQKKKDFSKRDM